MVKGERKRWRKMQLTRHLKVSYQCQEEKSYAPNEHYVDLIRKESLQNMRYNKAGKIYADAEDKPEDYEGIV